ncbi:glycerol-3-phosphate dehydrogenase/oxidase [Flavihumibacter rivuli]|uniref:glycerol-3-phosphate dehydrogenase/oxidase n=1 Tax=Flavihumibacter rivuli TaxID=2838156 RepID=UPI001BDE0C8E|nr:glycerol-3-phosphate dehydrogenase/oxidase [Flavihumibacter rivuli]ULQ55004.1 glycerol-3-phosphate dehydrogenase/oxidase [Flavihumibacter rivuli]
MFRPAMIDKLKATREFDVCIIGGGATGLGIAIDAASRGFTTVLLEGHDFAKATSSRSTKLVHGGVRYLQQGNVKLVMEALKERGLLRKNAPHLVKNQSFILPNYKWWEGPYYGIGLKIYDWMAGKLGLGPSEFLSKEETLEKVPTLDPEGLKSGVLYHDGQFDDARLAINLAQSAAEHGAVVLNYFRVDELIKANNKTVGVHATDTITGDGYEIRSKVTINATGIFTDTIRHLDESNKAPVLSLSQGTHLVVEKTFLPGDTAILIPETSDGRVLFAVPWHNKLIIGTTDIPVSQPAIEPIPQDEEIHFILQNISRYLAKDPTVKDVKSVFSGLRPLVKGSAASTAALSRDHYIEVSQSGLVSITGGKWTTYRKMAEDVLRVCISQLGLNEKPCITENLAIHGAQPTDRFDTNDYYYGTDAALIRDLEATAPASAYPIHPNLPYTVSQIVWAVRNEMCMTVDDALSRRTRALLLDARAAMEAAPLVAAIMAREMGKDEQWQTQQVDAFSSIARHYLPPL